MKGEGGERTDWCFFPFLLILNLAHDEIRERLPWLQLSLRHVVVEDRLVSLVDFLPFDQIESRAAGRNERTSSSYS